ncbi:acyl carrier protein phosphodiesterase [Algoriphagus sp. PAP.12]|uniref:acyl carrier protein phosphodiesterase n=1 Tax=Algoriphagus sp. PAP.12 TaxID=2996678 RepID=UPI00227AF1F8|nr:ACP phosphodiesterase [Algoriphagus sp. PAP.12]
MNFLAHAFLSFQQEKILVGNFIADFVKGKQINDFEDGILMGILLHREIDFFTDSHPLVKAGQSYLRPKFGHYSTVITDIFFDYFLIKHWKEFKDIPLETFIQETFETLDSYEEIFPPRFANMYYWMRQDNWLLAYGSVEGIQSALTGMSKRTKFNSKMEEAHLALVEREKEFDVIFLAFFKDLETFAFEKLQEIQQAHGRH